MLYVSLLWPCLLQTLGYLSSFFLAERKLRWPSLPLPLLLLLLLLLSPLTPQLICPQVATESFFLSWATSSPPRSQLIVIRTAGPTHSGPSTAFLFRSLLTTLCQLHRFCKGFGQWTEDRERRGRGIKWRGHSVSETKLETGCVSSGYARLQYHYAATYWRMIWTAMTPSFYTLAPTWALLVTSEKKATEELRGVPVYATMWPKNISLYITSAMANGLNSYNKSWACAVHIHNK